MSISIPNSRQREDDRKKLRGGGEGLGLEPNLLSKENSTDLESFAGMQVAR
jgi:hypothetical protein